MIQVLMMSLLKVVLILKCQMIILKKQKSKKQKVRTNLEFLIILHEVVKIQLWPQSKLQFEYAGSKINFDDLEFNLIVAGELEILSSSKINQVERIGRTKLLTRTIFKKKDVRRSTHIIFFYEQYFTEIT